MEYDSGGIKVENDSGGLQTEIDSGENTTVEGFG